MNAGGTADCIDTDPPTGRGYSGQSGQPLIEIAHVHHATWVMFTETRCNSLWCCGIMGGISGISMAANKGSIVSF
jgi:hypothetical protein